MTEEIIMTVKHHNGRVSHTAIGEVSRQVNSAYATDLGTRYYARTLSDSNPLPYPHGIFCEAFSKSYRNRRVREHVQAQKDRAARFPEFTEVIFSKK